MKKQLLLIVLSFLSYGASATHILGGEITWEKTANGQFIFELTLYRECGSGSALLSGSMSVMGPNGAIPVTRQSITEISPVCTGVGQVQCGTSSAGMGAVEQHVYSSQPTILQGTPPVSGWEFSLMLAGRATSIVNLTTVASNYYISSTMYPGYLSSSPYFVGAPNQTLTPYNKTFSIKAVSDSKEDSLYYSFALPKESMNGGVGFISGYSLNSPFPSLQTNAANGPVLIDGNSGLITYDAVVAVSGLYTYAVAVEQWRYGVLISRITRDFSVAFNSGVSSNNAPSIQIDTNAFPNIIQTGPYSYKTFVTIGDTVEFNISGADSDVNSSTSLLQQIDFDANGSALSSLWGGLNAYVEQPTLAPVSPQTGFASADTNSVNFKWAVQNEHFNPHNNSHFFTFTFKDDQCPYPGMTSVTLQVVVQKAVSISVDTLQLCAGDSIQLSGYSKSGNYAWSPVAGLSDPSVASPMASPAASGYYYLNDPVSGVSDSVYVEVTTPATFTLAQSGGFIVLTDANPATSTMWYYNGIPFYYPHDSLYILGYGDYWVKGAVGPCPLLSDTVRIDTGTTFSVSDPSMGAYNGTNAPISGSQGITFALSQVANLESVSIPGLVDLFAKKSSGYELNLKVYDANQTEVFTTDITLQRPMDGLVTIPVNFSLTANTDYTIAISGDSAYTFSMIENVSYPMTPFHNGITVKGSFEGSFEQFPAQPSNYLIPFSLKTDVQVVSLAESNMPEFSVYPNPVANRFTLDGLSGASKIELMDVNGKLISTFETTDKSMVIERAHLPSGVYFIKVSDANTTSLQKVMFK